jgi:hypothetical protein
VSCAAEREDAPAPTERPGSRETPKSGEGADTALQALIRKRKLDPGEAAEPQSPPQPG